VTTQPTLAPGAFAAKWRGVTTTEPTPHEADPTGDHCAFEKRDSNARVGES
jgi:hypothetical protein